MRRPLTSAQLAQFAEIGEDRIDEYRSRGLIDPDRDGEMDDWDVLRLRILMHYESLGRSMDEIEKAIRDGSTSVIYSDLLWGDADAFVVPEQIADELGVPLEDIEALLRAIGLTGSIPRSDLKFFEMMKSLVDGGLPMKLLLEVARVYGDSLRRLAQTEVRMIRDVVAEPGRSSLLKDRAQSERLQAVQEVLEPVLEPMLLSIHRRHLMRASVQEAVADLEAAERGEDRETLEATIAFVDLASFTSLAQIHGDEVAAGILDRFDELVRQLLEEHGGTLVKQIGDAAMLVFTEPVQAVRFSIGLDATASREPNFPALRTGIHSGPVLYRVGDYVGNTVNLAARIAAMAGPNEILVTEPMAEAAVESGVTITPAGEHELSGIEGPIFLWRLESRAHAAPERDPVCGMAIGSNPVARLVHHGRQFSFCSEDCLRRFLEDPGKYLQPADRAEKPEL